ncbi:hypothetical protein T4E_3860 [Trichinella pseudospiralis]|uniref:Uncharacterized protein n=1 Tax=Trichinella pseudospiralis TaxID=6337 RepID=A0A0V0XYN0_TRIPS|nr:hypothetical protein T4E_3860 [Trichinella pseudospiralis]
MDVRCQLRLIYYLLGFVPVEMAALCVCRAAATFGSTLGIFFISMDGFSNPPSPPSSTTPTTL